MRSGTATDWGGLPAARRPATMPRSAAPTGPCDRVGKGSPSDVRLLGAGDNPHRPAGFRATAFEMLRVHAFEALRPAGSRAALVSCPAHGVASAGHGTACGCCEPIRTFQEVLDTASPEEARRAIERLQSEGILCPDPQPCMYVYRIAREGRRQIGIVALVDRGSFDPAGRGGDAAEIAPTWA